MAKLLYKEDLLKMDGQMVFCVPTCNHIPSFSPRLWGLGWHLVDAEKGTLEDGGSSLWYIDRENSDNCDGEGYYPLIFDEKVTLDEAIEANKEYRKVRGYDPVEVGE